MKEWITKLSIAALAVLAPIHAILISVGILIIVDLITGILAATKRKEKITSAALRRTISKMVVYNLAVISGFLLEKYLLSSVFPVAKLVAGVIGMVEFTSILENGNTILGENVFKNVLKKLGSENDKKKE